MSYCIHQVPGRLRVNTPLLRRNPALATRVREHLDTRSGIEMVKVSTLTGSITIYYDPRQTDTLDLLAELGDAGFVSDASLPPKHPFPVTARFLAAPDKRVWFLANVVFSVILKTAVESLVGPAIGRAL